MNPDRYRIPPDASVHLKNLNSAEHHFWRTKEEAAAPTQELLTTLDRLQERLYASRERSLLIVLQGMDTSGKDGTIRHVMTGISPQGCEVTSFKAPTSLETAHDFLWRIHPHAPAKGMIGIFNRSHYEDVCITRVHGWIDDKEAHRRLKAIRHFEKELADNGTVIVKFFLHISKEEQARRLQERADDPEKRWKFSLGDLAERRHWKRYRKAYQDAIEATSTDHAPWFVVPADHKWYRNWVIARVLVKTLEGMRLATPKADSRINFKKIHLTHVPSH